MYIKDVEIDGFKSYGRMQKLVNFDTQFNAITGLNGSGKSNILDAICFLLGISNLAHVRAGTMDDLVYKQGQAGVQKASVTVTFDNSDKSASPIGYESVPVIRVSRSVIIKGKTSYSINGSNSTMTKVQELFRSVGLNVNRPHFLIMQGRIAKVLNMKPHEILGMIEEAAGTTLYDQKREASLKQLRDKDETIKHIDELFNNDVTPKIERLKAEKEGYLNFQRVERECALSKQKLIVFEYKSKLSTLNSGKAEIERQTQETGEFDELIQRAVEEINEMEAEMRETNEALASESAKTKGNLQESLKVASKEYTDLLAQVEKLDEDQTSKQKDIAFKNNQIKSDEKDIKKFEAKLVSSGKDVGGDADRRSELENIITTNQEKLSNLARGQVDDGEGNAMSLKGLIGSLGTKISALETTNYGYCQERKRIEKDLPKAESDLGKISKDSARLEEDLASCESKVAEVNSKMGKINFDETIYSDNRRRVEDIKFEVENLRTRIRDEKQLNGLEVNYNDPNGYVNTSDIFGTVGLLMKVKDPRFYTAMDTALGGNIRNVVVKSSDTAASLLKCRMQNRISFLPLNELKPRLIRPDALRRAREIGGPDNVWYALDLIDYDPKYEKAMQFVCGNVLICSTSEVAKKVCFDKGVYTRCVNLLGDDYNPQGIMSGGSSISKSDATMFDKIDKIREMTNTWRGKERDLHNTRESITEMEKCRSDYHQAKSALTDLTNQQNRLKSKLESSDAYSLKLTLERYKLRLGELEQLITTTEKELESCKTKLEEAQRNEQNEAIFTANEIKKAKKELAAAEKELQSSKDKFIAAEKLIQDIQNELETLRESIVGEMGTIKQLELEIEELEVQKQQVIPTLNAAKDNKEEKEKVLQGYIDLQRNNEMKIENLKVLQMEKIKERDQFGLKKRAAEKSLEALGNKIKEVEVEVKEIEKAHEFVIHQREHFDKPGTNFVFTGETHETLKAKAHENAKMLEELGKSVNKKAIHLLATSEDTFNDLIAARNSIDEDKASVMDTIKVLEEMKRKALIEAYEKVNGDFHSIFSTLLPGCGGKLQKTVNDENALVGLEVRISFNGQFKESLSELSGGQRSLIALSLILAMLKYSPAPLYILDEVDAALDLSHTQNIGEMIKKHFTQSQFVIVSLKDGMFNNANVLFKTQFLDGSSVVKRIPETGFLA
uniref:Structural maintenance of chromosomes protein n=1 Tax=Rhabditophanes sp. KR3021 TaxID=114890 RepID=A0AC35U0H0_9BILA